MKTIQTCWKRFDFMESVSPRFLPDAIGLRLIQYVVPPFTTKQMVVPRWSRKVSFLRQVRVQFDRPGLRSFTRSRLRPHRA